jgi:hypothetical protein
LLLLKVINPDQKVSITSLKTVYIIEFFDTPNILHIDLLAFLLEPKTVVEAGDQRHGTEKPLEIVEIYSSLWLLSPIAGFLV